MATVGQQKGEIGLTNFHSGHFGGSKSLRTRVWRGARSETDTDSDWATFLDPCNFIIFRICRVSSALIEINCFLSRMSQLWVGGIFAGKRRREKSIDR